MLSTRQTNAGDRSKMYQILYLFFKIVEFHDHIIRNHHEKYFEISTNMPVIGSLIRKITVKISEIWESKVTILLKQMLAWLVLSMLRTNRKLESRVRFFQFFDRTLSGRSIVRVLSHARALKHPLRDVFINHIKHLIETSSLQFSYLYVWPRQCCMVFKRVKQLKVVDPILGPI